MKNQVQSTISFKHPIFSAKISIIFYFAILVFASLCGIIWSLYTTERTNKMLLSLTEKSLDRYVSFIELHINHINKHTEQILSTVASEIPKDQLTISFCKEKVDQALRYSAGLYNIGVFDKSGNQICSALTPIDSKEKINISDRSFFLNTLKNKAFSAGSFQIGLITKKPTVGYGYPVFDDKGEIQYIVSATLNLEFLNPLLKETNMPDKAIMLITDKNGTILSSFPDNRKVGKFGFDTTLMSALIEGEKRTTTLKAEDGAEWVFAYTPVDEKFSKDMIIAVGIPKTTVLANNQKSLAIKWLYVGTLFVVLATFGFIEANKNYKRD